MGAWPVRVGASLVRVGAWLVRVGAWLLTMTRNPKKVKKYRAEGKKQIVLLWQRVMHEFYE